MNTTGNTDHFLDLDGVRGILANVVMLYHFGLNTLLSKLTSDSISHAPWGACVDFFFILSGFVLCHSILKRPKTPTVFFLARIFRLLPLHITILALSSPLYISIIPLGAGELIQNIFGLSVFTGVPIWNMASWSMQLELYVPLVFFIYKRLQGAAFFCMAGFFTALLLQVWTTHQMSIGVDYPVLRAIGGLSLGFFLYKLKSQYQSAQLKIPKFSVPVITAGYLFTILLSGFFSHLSLVLPLISIAIIVTGVSSHTFLSTGIFRLMGDLSYPIYMIHAPALIFALSVVPSIDGSAPLKLALIAFVWVVSYGAMHLIERPGMALGRMLQSRVLARA